MLARSVLFSPSKTPPLGPTFAPTSAASGLLAPELPLASPISRSVSEVAQTEQHFPGSPWHCFTCSQATASALSSPSPLQRLKAKQTRKDPTIDSQPAPPSRRHTACPTHTSSWFQPERANKPRVTRAASHSTSQLGQGTAPLLASLPGDMPHSGGLPCPHPATRQSIPCPVPHAASLPALIPLSSVNPGGQWHAGAAKGWIRAAGGDTKWPELYL